MKESMYSMVPHVRRRMFPCAAAAVAAMALGAVEVSTSDFVGMDTTSPAAQEFWDVSGHDAVVTTTTEATLGSDATIDSRAYGVDADAIGAFDSRYRTDADSNMIAEFRSDMPHGTVISIR